MDKKFYVILWVDKDRHLPISEDILYVVVSKKALKKEGGGVDEPVKIAAQELGWASFRMVNYGSFEWSERELRQKLSQMKKQMPIIEKALGE